MKKEELGNEIMNSHDGSSDVTGLVHEVDVEQVNRTTGGSSKMKKDIFGPGSEYDDVSEPLMSMVDSNGENTNSRYYQ